jgi:hypothetical protein
MDLRRLLGQMNMGGAAAGPAGDTPMVDTAETVHVSSLALLKMLKHGMFLTPPKAGRKYFSSPTGRDGFHELLEPWFLLILCLIFHFQCLVPFAMPFPWS